MEGRAGANNICVAGRILPGESPYGVTLTGCELTPGPSRETALELNEISVTSNANFECKRIVDQRRINSTNLSNKYSES